METLVLNENQQLTYKSTDLEKEAGIEMFAIYEDINVLEVLSNGNPLLWDDIMALPYERVLTQMMMNQDKRRFGDNLRRLMTAKNESH